MNSLAPTILVVDGEFFLHRAMHVPELSELRTSTGVMTGGVYGVISAIHTTLLRFPAVRRCIAVFDTGRSARRLALFPDYKGNRSPKPGQEEEREMFRKIFDHQKNLLLPNVASFGMRLATLPVKEGDDIIGWFAKNAGGDVVIASEDKDLYQLVSQHVAVFRPIRDEFVCHENFKTAVGVARPLFLVKKAICGDKSDNIPGVPKVADTTAGRIMEAAEHLLAQRQIGRLQELITESCKIQMEADSRNRGRYASVLQNLDIVSKNLDLMDLRREPFTQAEELSLRMVLDSSLGCFNETEALRFLHLCEFRSFTETWADFSKPFRMLR